MTAHSNMAVFVAAPVALVSSGAPGRRERSALSPFQLVAAANVRQRYTAPELSVISARPIPSYYHL